GRPVSRRRGGCRSRREPPSPGGAHQGRPASVQWSSCVRVGRRSGVLRVPSSSIPLDGYAAGRGPGGQQIERYVRTRFGEQPRPLTDDDRIDKQVELVDQAVVEQPSDEDATAGYHKFAVLMRLQLPNRCGDVAGE